MTNEDPVTRARDRSRALVDLARISCDPTLIAELCDRIEVLEAGNALLRATLKKRDADVWMLREALELCAGELECGGDDVVNDTHWCGLCDDLVDRNGGARKRACEALEGTKP